MKVVGDKCAGKSSPKTFVTFWAILKSSFYAKMLWQFIWATFGNIWATFLLQYLVTLFVSVAAGGVAVASRW